MTKGEVSAIANALRRNGTVVTEDRPARRVADVAGVCWVGLEQYFGDGMPRMF